MTSRNKPPGEYTQADLDEVVRYEREASCYGLQLLHDLGIQDLDSWLTDFSATDIAYLVHFYRTGEKLDPHTLWKSGHPLLQPMPTPPFTPRLLKLRSEGVVI